MVLAHVTDSWTRAADRATEPYYVISFIGGVASPLFLFLAGVGTAMSAASKARRYGDARTGAALARRRGVEIFGLALLFRLQSQLLSGGPVDSLLKVDMLNIMGVSIVLASYVWQWSSQRTRRVLALAIVTGVIAMITPIVRDVTWLAPVPDPLEAYLRPAGGFAAFPFFPWAGFLFAGVLVGDLVDAVRQSARRQVQLQNIVTIAAGAGVMLAWAASFQPSIYPSATFWSDSPTFFFIRLGLVALLVPASWVIEQLLPAAAIQPIAVLGRSSLFVYWIHVEMVYGAFVQPIKRTLPLSISIAATALIVLGLYALVLLKNRYWRSKTRSSTSSSPPAPDPSCRQSANRGARCTPERCR